MKDLNDLGALLPTTEERAAMQAADELNRQGLDDAGRRIPVALDDEVYDLLPTMYGDILRHYADPLLRGQQLLAMLTMVSAVMPNVRLRHDNRLYGPSLMCVIYGSPSSGKGRIDDLLPLVTHVAELVERESEEQRREWRKRQNVQRVKMSRLSRQRDLSDEQVEQMLMADELAEEPLPRGLFLADSSTVPAMIQRMKGNEPHAGLLFSNELVTLINNAKTDYGNLREMMLKAFHEERIHYTIKTGGENIIIRHARLSVLLSGTYASVRTLMPTLEDGLPSRFLFYETPCDTTWRSGRPTAEGKELMRDVRYMGRQLLELYKELRRSDRVPERDKAVLLLSDAQEERLDEVFRRMNDWYLGYYGHEYILSAVRRRLVDAKRMVLQLALVRAYEHTQSWPEVAAMPTIEADDDDIEAVVRIMEYVMQHTANAFALLQCGDEGELPTAKLTAEEHLGLLHEQFTTGDVVRIGREHGLSLSTCNRRLRFWLKGQFISKIDRGTFARVTKNS